MKKRRGKRRAKGQKIGAVGEGIFAAWAPDHGLAAVKAGDDYGIDFFCTVFRRLGAATEEATGAVLAVQVRSTSVQHKGRIRLDRIDAEAALRVDSPFAVVGIDTVTREVRFRFMDEALITELQTFLRSAAKYVTWPLRNMESGDKNFAHKLAEVRRPAFQQRLRWIRARQDIESVVRGSRISFVQNEKGAIAILQVPFVTSLFAVPPGDQEKAATVVFADGDIPAAGQAGKVGLHPEITALSDLVDGPLCVAGPFEKRTSISVVRPGMGRITIPASIRSVGDEHAYVLTAGLYLAISAARKHGELYYHHFRQGIGSKKAVALGKAPEELAFLKALRDDAQLALGPDLTIPVANWGQLTLLGQDIENVETGCRLLGISLDSLLLADAVQLDVLMTSGVLAALLQGVGIEELCPGFIFEGALSGPIVEDAWSPCRFRIPIVMNHKSAGVIVWSIGEGSTYKVDNAICGFRAERQVKWSHELRPERFPNVVMPELWFHREWPPIPLDAHLRGERQSLTRAEPLALAGEIYDET